MYITTGELSQLARLTKGKRLELEQEDAAIREMQEEDVKMQLGDVITKKGALSLLRASEENLEALEDKLNATTKSGRKRIGLK